MHIGDERKERAIEGSLSMFGALFTNWLIQNETIWFYELNWINSETDTLCFRLTKVLRFQVIREECLRIEEKKSYSIRKAISYLLYYRNRAFGYFSIDYRGCKNPTKKHLTK